MTYFPSLSNLRDSMLGDQKLGSSCQEQPLCSGNLMMFMNHQDPSCRDYSDIFSGVSSNYVDESVGDHRSNCEMDLNSHLVGILDDSNFQCQGVSLGLSTHSPSVISMPSFPPQYQTPAMASSFFNAPPSIFEKRLNSKLCMSDAKNGMYMAVGSGNSMSNSIYIEAAQQLLDEMVSVREALKELKSKKLKGSNGLCVDSCRENDGGSSNDLMCSDVRESSMANPSCDLSPTERQELKNKNSKLLSLLGEVDRRYKQYYQQLQFLAASFDMVAGRGAAEFYTALAHRTISCHVRRLRDAINAQIEVTRRALGEQDPSHYGQEGIPRLRFVDQQLRQQRALQQLGVTPHSWRPQRGLPESSVSILRAWLFEHFLHPYPKDSEKLKLARQTGLTRNQVANWFINARVRLWKPMVEEMYKEEFGDSNMDIKSSSPENNASKASWNNSLFSEDRGGDELHDSTKSAANNGERVLYRSCSTDDMIKSSNFSVSGDISLALELKHCEGDEFGMFGSNSRMVGSVELEAQDFPCLEPERHHQCRLTSSNMLHDFVV